jgi:hypothetical protein
MYTIGVSSTSDLPKSQVLEWLKSSGLLSVTLCGLLLYVFLSVPATIFYSRLGVSPSEVGLSYANLLSGSTAEVIAILLILTSAFLFIALFAAMLSVNIRGIPWGAALKRVTGGVPLPDLPDDKFYEYVELSYKLNLHLLSGLSKEYDSKYALKYDNEYTRQRRVRDLRRLGVLMEEQSAELDELSSRTPFPDNLGWLLAKRWIRSHGRLLATFFVAITVVIVLPTLAFIQAGQVLQGRQYFGSGIGIFDYYATPARISPSSASAASSVEPFERLTMFLIGENSQYLILYSPTTHSTVRFPEASVIVASVK